MLDEISVLGALAGGRRTQGALYSLSQFLQLKQYLTLSRCSVNTQRMDRIVTVCFSDKYHTRSTLLTVLAHLPKPEWLSVILMLNTKK